MNTKKSTILIVDDETANCRLLEMLLQSEGYRTLTANSGEAALALVAKQPPDLILLDVMMPGLDGYQVASKIKSDPVTKNIPIIMVTSLKERGDMLSGLNVGAEEYINKPVDRVELFMRVRNLLRLKEYSDLLGNYNKTLEQQVQARTQQLRDSYIETIFIMTRAAEHKDEDTGAHVNRISYYSKHLAEVMGLDSEFTDNIFYASPMHDIGKIGIPDAILLKPGKHTPEEFEIMKSHSVLGAEILLGGNSPYTKMGMEIALGHHECWDGGGYPHGLQGEAIPLAARIMCICDVYDALRSKRPYKPAFDHEKSVSIIIEGDGRTLPQHFDPAVLDAFQRSTENLREIYGLHAY